MFRSYKKRKPNKIRNNPEINKTMEGILTEKKQQPDEIELIISPPENNDIIMTEETYSDHSEALLKNWLKIAEKNSEAHNKKGRHFKFMHEIVGIPAIIIPGAFSPIYGFLSDKEGIEIANIIVLIVTFILTTMLTFFSYQRKSELHFRAESNYADLYSTVLVELSKERNFRIRVDRFVEMIQAKIDFLGATSPLL